MLPSATFDPAPQTAAEFDSRVRLLARSLGDKRSPASMLFRFMTSVGKASPGLTAEQLTAANQLDELARTVCRGWLLRRLADTPANDGEPPTADLADRFLDRGKRLRASVVAHAEAIALEAVLAPEQAEAARRWFWRELGVKSLLDPELATRLRLSRQQRANVLELDGKQARGGQPAGAN